MTSLQDMQEDGASSCCGAKVYMGICADCKEHCDAIQDEQDDIQENTDSLEEKLEALNKK